MSPTFCTIPRRQEYADPLFAAAAEQLRGAWPGLVVDEVRDGACAVLIAADGSIAHVPATDLTPGLPEEVALDLMDAVEEAIEDAQERGDSEQATRLEATLDLLEHALDDPGS